ncbi:GNAT family N-acetyltransferase [Dyella agri]|uniref:N-acetyltransferase n=1 Tax=Dyella agri TaxID=1926869 RepID=A0ABW8KBF8_9GAMM
MQLDIRHDRAEHRFEVEVEGVRCVLEYLLAGGVMTITHTGVPSAVGGRGVAGELVRRALDTARAEGWKVQPACSYSAAWMKRHPEYAELRA